MMHAQLERARREWRMNRRLRLGALVILLVAGVHVATELSDRRSALAADYLRDAELVQRLQDASREAVWPKRARQAEAALRAERESLPAVSTAGAAKAELQAWLNAQIPPTGVRVERVEVEAASDVPDYPGLWQVPARVDVVAPLGKVREFMRLLGAALPWVQTERVEASGEGETRLSVILRGYYRKGARDAAGKAGKAAEDARKAAVSTPAKPLATAAGAPNGKPVKAAKPADAAPRRGQSPITRGIVPTIARSPAPAKRQEGKP